MTNTLDRTIGRHIFGDDVAGYAAARPGYSEDIYRIVEERCGLAAGVSAFEIGPGTGQATKRLLELGADPLTAIEPDERLAQRLRDLELGPNGRQLRIRNESFEEIELAPGSFGCGVAATSFHWLEPLSALEKILSLLEPGGGWAMWWNVFHDPADGDGFSNDVQHLLSDIRQPPSFHDKRHYSLDTIKRLAELERAGFVAAQCELVRTDLDFSAPQIAALYATFSAIRQLTPADRDRRLAEIREVAEDKYSGTVRRTILSPVYTARKPRVGAEPRVGPTFGRRAGLLR